MEGDRNQLEALLPNIAAQMRGALSNLHLAAAQLVPAAQREQDPDLDARAALLDQSYYQLLRLAGNLSAAAMLQSDAPLSLQDGDIVEAVSSLCEQTASLAELAGVHLAIDGSRVNKETFCAAENSKFGLTPIIDYDVRHLDLLTSLVESNNCVSIVPAVKYKELSLQGKHPDLVFREYADGAPTAYWGIAYNKRRPLTELGQCFRAFVQSYFTSIDTRYADAQEPSAG